MKQVLMKTVVAEIELKGKAQRQENKKTLNLNEN